LLYSFAKFFLVCHFSSDFSNCLSFSFGLVLIAMCKKLCWRHDSHSAVTMRTSVLFSSTTRKSVFSIQQLTVNCHTCAKIWLLSMQCISMDLHILLWQSCVRMLHMEEIHPTKVRGTSAAIRYTASQVRYETEQRLVLWQEHQTRQPLASQPFIQLIVQLWLWNVCDERRRRSFHRDSLSLHFNGHSPGEPGLAGVYWSKGWWRWWRQLKL